jgi:hypothetical protein
LCIAAASCEAEHGVGERRSSRRGSGRRSRTGEMGSREGDAGERRRVGATQGGMAGLTAGAVSSSSFEIRCTILKIVFAILINFSSSSLY